MHLNGIPSITITQVLEHLYCPRFTYFEHVLAIPETIGLGHLVSIGFGDVRRNQRRVGFLNN